MGTEKRSGQNGQAIQTIGIKVNPWLVGFAGVLALSAYFLVTHHAQTPDRQLDEILAANPEMAASLESGGLVLLQDSDKALAEAQKALTDSSSKPHDEISEKSVNQSPPVRSNAWSHSTQAASPSIPLAQSVSVYQQVDVDMETPAFPSPGEQVSLALPGNQEVVVNVETGVTNPNGDYTWRGHLEGHGTDYPVVMTYGGASVFATITTPEGSYTMESINGSGWVYKNPSEFELSHAGVNDYLEIPETHHQHE